MDLNTSADILDVDVIEAAFVPGLVGRKVLVYKSTSSTSDVAWEYSRNAQNDGLAVFAESQSSGRGRRGNKWLCAEGQSILCSILLLDFPVAPELMTTASAIAVAEAVTDQCVIDARLKWPNDVMINSRKVAGLLLESRPAKDGRNYVIGIGLNVHQQPDFFDNTELLMPATSLDIATGFVNDRNLIAAGILRSFDKWFEIAKTSPRKIVERWMSLSTQIGMHVTVEYNQQRFSGNCIGVDPAAGLILQLDRGGVRMFNAAHTTIVKHL